MSLRLVLIATVTTLTPSLALSAAPPAQPATIAPRTSAPTTPAPAAPRQKAGPEARAQAERLDPLARAAFWAREVDADPGDVEAALRFSQGLRALGQYDQAATVAQRALVVHPDIPDLLMEVARARVASGQAFYAVEPLRRACDLSPRDWRPLSLLGVAYDQLDRNAEADAAWRKALSLSPSNPIILANLGMAALSRGDAKGAETYLRQAASQSGAGAQIRQNLALVLGLQGKLAEAETLLRNDLPPEAAEQNLAWLRGRLETDASAPRRTWNSLQDPPPPG